LITSGVYIRKNPRRLGFCKKCKKERILRGKDNLCNSCSNRINRKLIICKNCGELKKHNAFGLCQKCYNTRDGKINGYTHKNYAKYKRKYYYEKIRPKLNIKGVQKGKYHWRWRGGEKANVSHHWNSSKWIKIRNRILERDNNICQYCGGKGCEVHHKIPYRICRHDNEENLVTVCRPCHVMEENKINTEVC